MALAFLGPRGTFSEEAALGYLEREGQKPDLVAFSSIPALTAAVETGLAERSILPIENSLDGSVSSTLDLLIHETSLKIRGEIVLPVRQFLVTVPGVQLGDIDGCDVSSPGPWPVSKVHRAVPAECAAGSGTEHGGGS